VLQWNDPWGGSGNDYDLFLTDSVGSGYYSASANTQDGDDEPMEIVGVTNNGTSGAYVYVLVRKYSGSDRRLKITSWGHGYFTEYYTATGSVWGHPAATNAVACGAVRWSTPSSIETFSSQGPTRIDFPSLTYRNKPDVCGADGVSVTGNGGFVTTFYGTSAAAPHVAAVCAQVWSAGPSMSNTTVRSLVENNAVDILSAGYDTLSGYGRVDALNAVNAIDSDGDGTPDGQDGCPADPNKTDPGQCGCGHPDTDTDGDGVADCVDPCPQDNPDDTDGDGICDSADGCPADPNKSDPGQCGCGNPDTDTDGDGVADCFDPCPLDNPDDTDGDGVCESSDLCVGDDLTGDCDSDGTCDDLDPCVKPVLVGAVSRKTHVGTGDWDINVGMGDIESRSAQLGTGNPNELTVIATFDIDVSLLGGTDVTVDVGTVTAVLPGGSGNELEILITDLPFNTQVNLGFAGVVDAVNPAPGYGSESSLCLRVIVGDYDNLGRTNFIDFSLIRVASYLNQLVATLDMARGDFDCGGRADFIDFSKVKNAGLINQTAPECP
jgi:hypothetical protein